MDYTRIITSRGNPDGPSLDGKEFEMVHLRMPERSGDYPFCLTGAYNIRWTRFQKLVTCPNCMKADISIHKIEKPIYCGDWHDKPLRWAVVGPRDEQQNFETKKNAMKYASIRRRVSDQLEAINLYQDAALGKSV